MKNLILYLLITFFTCAANAQKGNNQLKLMAETGFSGNQVGFGGYIKGLYGVVGSGQLTLTAGVSRFKSKNASEHTETTIRLIPVLAGYKKNIKKFYVEPQMGYGELGGKIKSAGDYSRPSVGAFFWAIGAGYDNKRFNIGARYQGARGSEGVLAGTWYNKSFHYMGIYACFSLLDASH